MIKNQDRSKWFGASDTATIMGNWKTQSFLNWWSVKLGLLTNNYSSWQMDCGNIMEHPIIDSIVKAEGKKIVKGWRPYYRPSLSLRCNYDGLQRNRVVEIKTTSSVPKTASKAHWQQVQVLMFRKTRPMASIYYYPMTRADYMCPYYPTIEYDKLTRFDINYDADWINNEYLPRLRYLKQCLKRRTMPSEVEFENTKNP